MKRWKLRFVALNAVSIRVYNSQVDYDLVRASCLELGEWGQVSGPRGHGYPWFGFGLRLRCSGLVLYWLT